MYILFSFIAYNWLYLSNWIFEIVLGYFSCNNKETAGIWFLKSLLLLISFAKYMVD
jgi:hypothetical protein